MNQQYYDYLKAKARNLLGGAYSGDRNAFTQEILRRFETAKVPVNERRFMAGFYMAQMGFGGGF